MGPIMKKQDSVLGPVLTHASEAGIGVGPNKEMWGSEGYRESLGKGNTTPFFLALGGMYFPQ